MRQESRKKQKRLHALEADIITIENIDLMYLAQRMYFYWTCYK